tara:strand:+ start:96 stop:344 length:249 start_codon:yes stop_codon:yes gene_type:complete
MDNTDINIGQLEYSVLVNEIQRGEFNKWNLLVDFVTKIKTRPIGLDSTPMMIKIKNNMTGKAMIADRYTPLAHIKNAIDRQE